MLSSSWSTSRSAAQRLANVSHTLGWMRRFWPSIVAATVGLTLSLAAWHESALREDKLAALELHARVADHGLVLQNGIDDDLDKIAAVQALFESSGVVNRRIFSAFGNAILHPHEGMLDVAWIPRVTKEQRAAFELAARRDGLPNYRIKSVTPNGRLVPAAEHDVYFPVLYTLTQKPDSPVYGLDLNDGGIRQQTLERARDSGEIGVSRDIELQVGRGDRSGFFVAMPVYRQGLPHATVQQRRDNLIGFVQGTFQTSVTLETILRTASTPAGLDLYFYSDDGNQRKLVYFHPSRLRSKPIVAEPIDLLKARPHRAAQLRVGDRQWTVIGTPIPGGPGIASHAGSALVLVGGLLFSALVTAFLWADGRHAQRIQAANRQLDQTLDALDRTNSELREQNTRFDTALNNMVQGLVMFNGAKQIVVYNDRYIEMYNLSREFIRPGLSLRALLQHQFEADNLSVDPDQRYAEIVAGLERNVTTTFITETGDGRAISVSNSPMPGGGWVVTHEDITARRRAEAEIVYLAGHDALTGLPNRTLFHDQLDDNIARVERGESLAVLCLDVDHFKEVNDTLGHPIGDLLLKATADRLRDCVRDVDLIARLGGDEFAIVQTGLSQPSDVTALASRVIETISQPYDIDGHQVIVGISAGIALAPGDGTDCSELLKNADMALYRAKADGRGRYCFFEPEMDARMQARRALELDLRKALVTGEFELFYQPLVDALTESVHGFEALVRWKHPQRGIISPQDFIPLAEETSLIVPLGEWILRQACCEAATWPEGISVAVNLSPVQFKSKNLVAAVISALAMSGLSPRRLELEITESVLLQDATSTLATLHRFRELGLRITMDDFGTGYSSLGYLRKFPFDKIKIDQSFVRDMSERDDSLAIVRAVAAMGASLGITTTAEGVETSAQLETLRKEGCTEVQGYLFSPPRPAADIKKLYDLDGPKFKASA